MASIGLLVSVRENGGEPGCNAASNANRYSAALPLGQKEKARPGANAKEGTKKPCSTSKTKRKKSRLLESHN